MKKGEKYFALGFLSFCLVALFSVLKDSYLKSIASQEQEQRSVIIRDSIDKAWDAQRQVREIEKRKDDSLALIRREESIPIIDITERIPLDIGLKADSNLDYYYPMMLKNKSNKRVVGVLLSWRNCQEQAQFGMSGTENGMPFSGSLGKHKIDIPPLGTKPLRVYLRRSSDEFRSATDEQLNNTCFYVNIQRVFYSDGSIANGAGSLF